MPKMFHRSATAEGQKVFIATPVIGGLDPGYTFALFTSSAALADAGIAVELAIYAGDCHVDDARNRLVRDFLETDCSDLIFIDSDIRWEPDDLVKLCQINRDVVGASYAFKQEQDAFPCLFLPGDRWAEPDGMLEVAALPTGFLKIRRHVLERLAESAIHFRPKSDKRADIPLIFERSVLGNTRWGGDNTFCRKWREIGGKVYLWPEADLDHTGENTWHGSIGHHLRVEQYGAIKAGLLEIRENMTCRKTMQDMVEAWANEWSVDAALLDACTQLARQSDGPILELGSGLSTLAMAATGAEVHAIEHDKGWIDRMMRHAEEYGLSGITVHHSPLNAGWYHREDIPDLDYALVLVDGPPRYCADRSILYSYPELLTGTVLIDDAEDPEYFETFQQWAEREGRAAHLMGQHLRSVAICPPLHVEHRKSA